jgi:hypothetical protein
MTDVAPSKENSRRFDLKQVLAFLIHPRQELQRLAAEDKPAWLMPMLIVCAAMLLRIILGGFFQARAAAMGEVTLPADWQWWTTEMQNNYMQAQQATQGPVFVYIIPAVMELVKIWLGWFVVSGLLHLASTLLGGRGSMRSVLNLTAWCLLAFAVRDLLRVVFILIAQHPVVSPGLSGFATAAFVSQLLANLDLFFIWFAILLGMGLGISDALPLKKAVAAVAVVLVVVVLAKAGLGTLTSNLSGMMITRTF